MIANGDLVAFAPAGLTEYVIPNGVSSIVGGTIMECDNLTTLTIPESVSRIYNLAIAGNKNLKNIYCKPSVPPTLDYRGIVLWQESNMHRIYVPTESVEAYKTAEGGWGDSLIQEVIVGYDF